jgi:hypothetical protein
LDVILQFHSILSNSPAEHEQTPDEVDSNRLGPETYLNDEGVLTTEI